MKTALDIKTTKYKVDSTSKFNKEYKLLKKQGKDISKLKYVVNKLANGEELEPKYKDHILINNKRYKNCRECHIEPDWLLVYKYQDDELVLLLFETGSHSELFNR